MMIDDKTEKDGKIEIEVRDGNTQDADETDIESDSGRDAIPDEKMTKSQLLERIKEIREDSDKNYDLYLRSQAELDNMKKRFQKEKEDLVKFCNDSLIRQLLPVVDSLEKAVTHSHDDNSFQALREGLELTLKDFLSTLKKAGVEEVKAIGEPFDPNFHEAMYEQEDDSVESGIVLQELQKGYMLNQRLIRPAMVSVSKGKTSD